MERKKLALVGTFEILADYGIPRHRVFRFMKRGLWPDTVAEIHAGALWLREDVDRAVTRLKAEGHLT